MVIIVYPRVVIVLTLFVLTKILWLAALDCAIILENLLFRIPVFLALIKTHVQVSLDFTRLQFRKFTRLSQRYEHPKRLIVQRELGLLFHIYRE